MAKRKRSVGTKRDAAALAKAERRSVTAACSFATSSACVLAPSRKMFQALVEDGVLLETFTGSVGSGGDIVHRGGRGCTAGTGSGWPRSIRT